MEKNEHLPHPSEKQTLEDKNRFERMVNTIPVMLYDSVLDPAGTSRFLYVAPGPCREILELDPGELLNDMGLVWNLIHPEDLERLYQEDLAANLEGKVFNSEVRIITPSGRLKWLRINSKPNPASPGEPVIWSGFLQDITESRKAEEERNRLANLVDVAPAAITIHDPDGNFLYANQKCLDMHGYTREEFLALNLHELDVPETVVLFEERKRQIEQHGSASFEVSHFRKDGSIFSLHVSIRATQWENKPAVESIAVDISEQKRVEDALHESRNLLHSVVENIPIRIFWKDSELNYLGCNTAFAEAAGFSCPEDLLGKDDFQMGWQEQAEMYRADDQLVIESGVPKLGIIEPQTTPAGERITVCTSKVPLFDDDNKVIGLLGIYEDITERLKAEEELKESEYFFKESQRSASIGSYKADLVGGYWESSEVLDSIFGIDESYNRSIQGWMDLVHLDDRERLETYLSEEIIGQKKAFAKEYRIIRHNDGETRWVYGLGALTFNRDGHKLSLLGTIQDITDQKNKEEERKTLENQLQQTQRIEALGRLAGGVAHDFNNMLSIILGHVEIAKRKEAVSPALHQHLDQIHNAAKRSADIVRQLLAFARRQTVTPKILDLNDTIRGMFTMLKRLIGEEVELAWSCENMLWPVKVDPGQIDQILANLCVNARDAIEGFGEINIEVINKHCDGIFCAEHKGLSRGDYVLLSVTDNGSGIEEKNLEKIFEPFFTTKGVGQGTGLGLATVYGIVKQNDGYIDVQSKPGEGTTFLIYFPRFTGENVGSQVEPGASLVERGKETVLLVEDEPAILDIGRQLLELQGYRVLTAETPGEAIRLAEEYTGDIHLLMTDVVMPEMNGRQLAKKILTLYPDIKRLFMSGYTADVIAHHGVLDDGIHFIHKPFSLDDLTTKLREVLDSSGY
ncbi:PAS domain S-box protein [Geopsychrobacter electrodiphilus]|uniref:PAS domain S-box protein n=1 Tax=Geopsychrobacter electrodiphilus TaxID=225196 RepID=UPI0003759F9B|nr:PAS domain S-box protein [Geopsychrobacter electrodiphilus]